MDDDDRFIPPDGRPRIDLTLNIGDVLKMVVMAGAIVAWMFNAHDSYSEITKHQDEKLLTHDIEINQMQKQLEEIRRQQKEDMVDVRASLKSISDALYEIKLALPHTAK